MKLSSLLIYACAGLGLVVMIVGITATATYQYNKRKRRKSQIVQPTTPPPPYRQRQCPNGTSPQNGKSTQGRKKAPKKNEVNDVTVDW